MSFAAQPPARSSARRICLGFLLAAFAFPLCAQTKPTEYEVKAAYLFNFGKFVRWPETATANRDSFSICVLGKDPFGKSLDNLLQDSTWSGKPIAAKRIASAEEASSCNVLFVTSAEAEAWDQILPEIARLPILTVSDASSFSRRGGMIQFFLSENRIRFEVNLNAAEKAGLNLDSQLLKVAVRVRKVGDK